MPGHRPRRSFGWPPWLPRCRQPARPTTGKGLMQSTLQAETEATIAGSSCRSPFVEQLLIVSSITKPFLTLRFREPFPGRTKLRGIEVTDLGHRERLANLGHPFLPFAVADQSYLVD